MEKLLRRLNHSWQRLSRDRHLIALYFDLDDPEYRLYDFYLAISVWDKKYQETYGTVEFVDRDVAQILSWSASKVSRTRTRLLEKGVISLKADNVYSIIPAPKLPENLLELHERIAWVHSKIAATQQPIASSQQSVAPVQQKQGYAPSSSLVSYKDNNSFLSVKKVVIKQEVRTEEEYQQMYDDNPDGLSPDDMRWIDENIYETLEVTPETENDIVKTYFDDDWNRYRSNLIRSGRWANINNNSDSFI